MVESLLGISTKRTIQTFYKSIDAQSRNNALGESISSISKSNTVSQLCKHDFSSD